MTEKAIAYGRKSFDDPERRTSSVDDQRQAAAAYAERHGFELIAFHGDEGITGATMERPGLQAMLASVRREEASIVIIEDVDRLGRDQEHLQHMIKIFRLFGVTLHTVAAGRIDDLVFSFKGIIGEQQRMRIAYTTRRGLKGKAARGGATGGRTLGYARKVLGQGPDGRDVDAIVVDEEQAALVRRIFQLYADGEGLKRICNIMNAEGIPSPRARETGPYNAGVWNPTTLSGNPALGEGILNNETYIGRRIFNRRRWIEVPNEKRGFSRRPRINPEAEWIIKEDSSLRIVDQELWTAVKARQAEARASRDAKFKKMSDGPVGEPRGPHLLSGLVECGLCQQPYLSSGGGRWRCKGHRTMQCNNGSIRTSELEDRTLTGLRTKLLTPAVIASFAAALQEELKTIRLESESKGDELRAALGDTRARMAKLLAQLEEEDDVPKSLLRRLKELEKEEERLADLVDAKPVNNVIRLPTNYEAVYRRAVDDLSAHLASTDATRARKSVRQIISKVVVGPGTGRGGRVRPMELHGDLFEMLEFAQTASMAETQKPRRKRDGVVVIGRVAGAGFEPATFRL